MNIIEQIKALFSKKTWSSSDANVSAQKILLGDANAEPSGIIGMNDLASVLGVRVVAQGQLAGRYNAPVTYGVVVEINAYYKGFLCFNNNGSYLWIGGYESGGSGENVTWHKVL